MLFLTVKIRPFVSAKNPFPVKAIFDVAKKPLKCLISSKLFEIGMLFIMTTVSDADPLTLAAKKQTANIR